MNGFLFIIGFIAGVGATFGMFAIVHFQIMEKEEQRQISPPPLIRK